MNLIKNKSINKYYYSIWVGGVEVNDRLLNKNEAEELAEYYKNEDYDDVIIEQIIKE